MLLLSRFFDIGVGYADLFAGSEDSPQVINFQATNTIRQRSFGKREIGKENKRKSKVDNYKIVAGEKKTTFLPFLL